MTRITSLSEDLLVDIIRNDRISHADVVALRLTCVVLRNAATVVLFHRIRISQLRRDRDTFLAICRSPHLAQHVREVEWQELSWFPGYFRRIPRILPLCDDLDALAEDDTDEICDKLDALAADLFWLPVVPYALPTIDGYGIDAQRREAIVRFRDDFHSVLNRLPYLHTVVSRPMSPDRIIDWCEYPLEVKLFQTHHPYHPPKDCAPLPQSNDGLFLFLLPAIERSALHITRLLWEDEFPGSSYLRPPCPEAFRRLDTMSISLVPEKCQHYDSLATNLEAATNVHDLSLGLGYLRDEQGPSDLQLTLLRFSLADNRTRWSQLHSLSVVSMPLVRKALVSMVQSNAGTLRHLYLCDCQLALSLIKQLSEIHDLYLKSLRVAEYDTPHQLVAADALLRFINKDPVSRDYHIFVDTPNAVKEKTFATIPSDRVRECGAEASHSEQQSVCSDASSEDSLDFRLRTGPKWVWGRYFHENTEGDVFCSQVPDSHPHGHRTRYWRFTSRDGRVNIGSDPLKWFDDWNPEAGDVEEPLPYCTELSEFVEGFLVVRGGRNTLERFLGAGSSTFEVLRRLKPPDGAIKYDGHDAKSAQEYED